jgi:hypothetical protein
VMYSGKPFVYVVRDYRPTETTALRKTCDKSTVSSLLLGATLSP